MVLTLFGMSVLIFVMLRLVPGNIADILFDAAGHRRSRRRRPRSSTSSASTSRSSSSTASGSAAWRAAISATPTSRRSRRSRRSLPRIPITAKLAGLALFFSVLFGVPLGVISAVRQNTPLDYVLRVLSLSGLSLPSFWLGLLMLMAFVHWFGTIPIYNNEPHGFWQELGLLGHSGGGGRLPQLGADHAADALVDARGAAPGLYPHRALQGRLRTARSTTTMRCATRCCPWSPSSASRRRSWSAA